MADPSQGFRPVVIRDAALARKLMGGTPARPGGGSIPVDVLAPDGTCKRKNWAIDAKAWDTGGGPTDSKPPKPGRESA